MMDVILSVFVIFLSKLYLDLKDEIKKQERYYTRMNREFSEYLSKLDKQNRRLKQSIAKKN